MKPKWTPERGSLTIFLCSSGLCYIREIESRARRAEERFEAVNEKLHYTLIRNKDLEKELEEIVSKQRQESGKEEEIEEEKIEEEKEDKEEEEEEEEGDKPVETAVKSRKKGKTRFPILLYLGYI